MAIKQHSTYYKDFSIKTYSETDNGIELLYKEYNRKGEVIYLRYPNGDYGKWKYDKNGYEIYHETNAYEKQDTKEFYWIKTKRTPLGLATFIEDSLGGWTRRKFDNDGRMTHEETNRGVTYTMTKINLDN